MQIAARESFAAARKRGWAHPYVADGLIALWDVEHGYNAGSIRDLVGGYDIAITGTPTLGSSGQYLNLGGSTTLTSAVVPFASILNRTALTGWTVEVVAPVNTIAADAVVCNYDFSSSSHRGLSVRHGGSYYAQTLEYLQNTYKIANGGSSSTRVISIVSDSTNNTAANAVSALFNNAGSKYATRGSVTATDGPFVFGINAKDNWYCARVYNRKLSFAERTANYAIDKARFNFS